MTAYAQRAGYVIHPVPVYYPELTEMLGERVYREVRAIDDRDDVARELAQSGIDVVQDRCLMVELKRRGIAS